MCVCVCACHETEDESDGRVAAAQEAAAQSRALRRREGEAAALLPRGGTFGRAPRVLMGDAASDAVTDEAERAASRRRCCDTFPLLRWTCCCCCPCVCGLGADMPPHPPPPLSAW
jgi:hypothetical protein